MRLISRYRRYAYRRIDDDRHADIESRTRNHDFQAFDAERHHGANDNDSPVTRLERTGSG